MKLLFMNTRFSKLLISMTLLLMSNVALSGSVEPSAKQVTKVKSQDSLQTLFLSHATREKIDKQRESYLHPVAVQKVTRILPKRDGVSGKRKVKRIYIPPRVEISAVIVKPDGSTLIRVNDKYNHSPSKYIDMDYAGSSTNGVPVTIQGKTKIVPVGSTLLTRQNRLVKTYKLEHSARMKSAPKTKQIAVKERLEQVKSLTPQ
jgi:hypothetical protein